MSVCIYTEKKKKRGEIPSPSLKISTFKVSKSVTGRKIGELFLKLSFKYTIENKLKSIYVTILPKYDDLINLFKDFGFKIVGRKDTEFIMMKSMFLSNEGQNKSEPLQFAIDYYPHFLDKSLINKFIIPIKPKYHDRLFPDVKERQTTIDDFSMLIPEGNTIKKVYICNSNIGTIRRGDIILFYRSSDRKEITSLGIVEKTIRTKDTLEIIEKVGNRTVYTFDEIKKIAEKDALVIIFRHQGNYNSPIGISTLQNRFNIKGSIQTIRKISHDDYVKIKQEGNGCW